MDEGRELKEEIIKGGAIAFFSRLSARFLRFASQIILARNLGPTSYGVYVLWISIIGVIQPFISLGVNRGIVRYGTQCLNKSDFSALKGIFVLVLRFILIMCILIGFTLLLFSQSIANKIFHDIRFEYLVKFMIFLLPLKCLSDVFASFAQTFRKIKYQMYIQTIMPALFNFLLLVIFFLTGLKLKGAVGAYVISWSLTALVAFSLVWRVFPFFRYPCNFYFPLEEIIKFSIPTFLTLISFQLLYHIDRIMLGYFRSSQAVGIYSASAIIAIQLLIFRNALATVFIPVVSELSFAERRKELKWICQAVSKWVFILTLPLFMIILSLPNTIINLFYGAEYVSGWKILILLSSANFINAFIGINGILLQMSGKQNLEFFNALITLLINFILNLILIPIFGIHGAAVSTATSLFILNLVRCLLVKRYFNFLPTLRSYFIPLVGGVVMLILVFIFRLLFKAFALCNKIYTIYNIGPIVVALVGYGLIMYHLGLEKEEKQFLFSKKLFFKR